MFRNALFFAPLVAASFLTAVLASAAPQGPSKKPSGSSRVRAVPPVSLTPDQLPTGKRITFPPLGTQQNVGSEPMNMVLTPDGKFALVSDMGYREYLTCLDTATGQLAQPVTATPPTPTDGSLPKPPVSRSLLSFGAAFSRGSHLGLYDGLAVAMNPAGSAAPYTVYAAQGANSTIAVVAVGADGSLTQTGQIVLAPGDFAAGLSLDGRGRLYVAINETNATKGNLRAMTAPGSLVIYDTTAPGVVSNASAVSSVPVVPNATAAVGGAPGVAVDNGDAAAPRVSSAPPAPVVARILFNGSQDTFGQYQPAAGATPQPFTPTNFPFAVATATDGSKVYVSSQRDGGIFRVDPSRPTVAPLFIPTGSVTQAGGATVTRSSHPVALLLDKAQDRLYVANAQDDSVSQIDTPTDTVTRTFSLRPAAASDLPGVTPTGLALSADEKTLYATLGDMNAVACIDLGAGLVSGDIPTGWYPTAVAVVPASGAKPASLLVANAKGTQAVNPNPGHVTDRPSPPFPRFEDTFYDEVIIEGSVSDLPVPDAAGLASDTNQVLANNRIGTSFAQDPLRAIGRSGAGPNKIQHVIYIIKENRTYDQVLGDEPNGNGDAGLVLFGRAVTPNEHALAERFVLLDNFYDCAEVSGDGWNWSTAGIANEYVLRNLPYNYSGRGRAYDFEGESNDYPAGGFPAQSADGTANSSVFPGGAPPIPDVATATNGYLWDQARKAGLSLRNYGWFLTGGIPGVVPDNVPATAGLQPGGHYAGGPLVPGTSGLSDLDYRQFDLDYADSDAPTSPANPAPRPYATAAYGKFNSPNRFQEWNREFQAMLQADPTGAGVPSLMLMKLMSDHTAGFRAGNPTPVAHVADNDYGVAEVVQAVSRSPIWNSTAIFVIEDDAQNGPDHVDCHRSTCYVISPWIKKNTVDHRFYNTDSVLHSIELLLGMNPMSQYDAFAPTFAPDFDTSPRNTAPYAAVLPAPSVVNQVASASLLKRDPSLAHLARLSARMDFGQEDLAPAALLNEIIWKSVKGSASRMPPPQHHVVAVSAKGQVKDQD